MFSHWFLAQWACVVGLEPPRDALFVEHVLGGARQRHRLVAFRVVHEAYDAFFALIRCQVFWPELPFAQLLQQGGSRSFPVAAVGLSVETDKNWDEQDAKCCKAAAFTHDSVADNNHE